MRHLTREGGTLRLRMAEAGEERLGTATASPLSAIKGQASAPTLIRRRPESSVGRLMRVPGRALQEEEDEAWRRCRSH